MSPSWRKEDPRPPIEVLGGEPPEEPPARVSLGGEGRSRRVVAVALLALAAIVAAGLALGGGDDGAATPERTTSSTQRRSTTTASTAPPVTAPHGPVLPVATGAALVVGSWSGAPWVHLDLDTGTRTELPPGGFEGGPVPVGVRGGVVSVSEAGARYLPLPSGEPVDLGPAGQALPTDRNDEVWLLSGPAYAFGEVDPRQPNRARVVGIDGASRSPARGLPDEGYVAGATRHGLVLSAGGRVYLLARDGRLRPVASGEVLATSLDHVVLSTCDDQARCEPELLDLGSGARRRLAVPTAASPYGRNVVVSPAGEVAVIAYGPESTLTIGRMDGGPTVTLEESIAPEAPAWLPAGQGLVMLDPFGIGVERVRLVDGRIERTPVTPLARDRGEFLAVIPP